MMKEFVIKYKKWLQALLLIVVLAFVSRFVMKTDFEQIGAYLKKMPATYLAVLGCSFLAYMCATLAWKLCLGAEDRKTNIWQLFMMRHVGEMLSVFNPTSVIAGETLKAHYLKKKNISKETGIGSILLSRILIMLSAIVLMLLSVVYLLSKSLGGSTQLTTIILPAVILAFAGYMLARFLLHSKLYLYRGICRLKEGIGKRFVTDKLCQSILEVNTATHDFFKHHRGKFMGAFALSAVHWIFGAAEFYIILKVLDFDITVIDAVAIEMGVIFFKTLGAVIPGQVGVEEYANKVMLDSVGIVSNEVWLIVSIMRRARQLFWIIIAALFYWIIKRTTTDLSLPDNPQVQQV